MSSLVISISCDNDAFAEHLNQEIARILGEQVGKILTYGPCSCMLRDVNGNVCGSVDWYTDEDEDAEDIYQEQQSNYYRDVMPRTETKWY